MANSKIKGIIVEIGGDTSGLQKALSKVNSVTSSLNKELKDVNSLLKLDPKNTELLIQKQELLNKQIQETSQELEILKQHQQDVSKSGQELTEEDQKKYRNLQREIINTENKLKNLQTQASKWTTAGKAIEEYGNKIQSLGKKIDSIGNKLTAGLTVPIVALGIAGVQSASTQEAAMQQVEKIYGDAVDTVKNFAENTALSFNMSTSDAYKYAQIYGNLIQSITDNQEENAKYTQELLEASSIIASATGRTMEDVMDRIRSGFLGNTEAIEDLGVNVNVAMIESTDAFKKFAGDKSWGQLDFQTQQQIRLFAILEQTSKKYGDEVNKNTSSDIQRLTARFKNLTSQLNKKLLPIADKLIDKAEEFLKELEDLDDEQIDNIINIGLMVAAAGPLVKILGTTTSVIGGVTKGVGLFSQAIAVMKNNTTSSSIAVNNLANGLKFMASPAGIATTAITAVAVGIAILKARVDEEMESMREATTEIENSVSARQNALDAINKQQDANLAEINNVKQLKDELSELVDKNGKVKDGYEVRAKFILNQLNEALGTEYKLNGDIIDSYKELQDNIDELILKKEAQIILEANEEKYKEAIQNKTKAYEDYVKTQEQINELQEKYNKLQEDAKTGMLGTADIIIREKTYKDELDRLNTVLQEQDKQLQEYNNNIATYQKNSELIIKGGEENLKKIEQSVTMTQSNITNTANENLQERIKNQIESNEKTKQLYDLEAKYNKDTKNNIYKTNVEEGQKNLDLLVEQLVERTSTVDELGTDETEAWKTLANNSYDEYSDALSKMTPEMRERIEEVTGVVSNDETVKKSMEELAEDAEKGFNDNVDGKTWGQDLVALIAGGINNSHSKQLISGAASSIAGIIDNILGFSVPEKGPLSNFDKSMPDMIDLMTKGLNNNKYKLLNAVTSLSQNLKDKLTLNPNMNLTKLQSLQNGVASNAINSTKTIFTTPQIVFNVQELDEAKLQQCFNYINRKFGSQY